MQHTLGDANGIVKVREVVQQNRELVAAKPRDRVARAQTAFELARDGDEQLIADGMPEAVVDHLEAVEVKEQHGEMLRGLPPVLLDGEAQVIREEDAIRQACERV